MKNYFWYRNEFQVEANNEKELSEFIESLSSRNDHGIRTAIDFNTIIPLPENIPYEEEYDHDAEFMTWRKENWGTMYNPSDITIKKVSNRCNIVFYTYKHNISDKMVKALEKKYPKINLEYIGDYDE